MFIKIIIGSAASPESECTCKCECGTCGDSPGEADGRAKGAGGVATSNAKNNPSS